MMIIKTLDGLCFKGDQSKTILESAFNQGYVFEHSCKNGQCGVCKTSLIEGSVLELNPQLVLTKEEKANNQILTCCCAPTSDILIDTEDLSALHGIEIKTLPSRINRLKLLSPEIIEVSLRFPPSASFYFLEGQYIDVIGPNAVRRSYSIASTSMDNEITLLIKKVEHGVLSDYWFNHAKPNDLLRIEGPKGTFFLREKDKRLIFLATGTGIAPVMAMLKKMDQDEHYSQSSDIYLFWGNRHASDFVWSPEFKKIKVDVGLIVSRSNDDWKGEFGYVQDIALSKISDSVNTDVYACGSYEMIKSAKQAFLNAGLKEKFFYSDAFVQSY